MCMLKYASERSRNGLRWCQNRRPEGNLMTHLFKCHIWNFVRLNLDKDDRKSDGPLSNQLTITSTSPRVQLEIFIINSNKKRVWTVEWVTDYHYYHCFHSIANHSSKNDSCLDGPLSSRQTISLLSATSKLKFSLDIITLPLHN